MKKKKKHFKIWNCSKIFLILALVLVSALTISFNVKASKYTYPTYPGADNWVELSQNREKLRELLEIPENMLINMNTTELLSVVLEYPCFNDAYYFDSLQEGFELVKTHFNGLEELLSREDVGEVIKTEYEHMNYATLSRSYVDREKLNKIANLELLLAQPEVSSSLSTNELSDIENTISQASEIRDENIDVYGVYKEKIFYKTLAAQQGKNLECKASRVSVKTPNGSAVAVFSRGEQISSQDKIYMNQEVLAQFPLNQIVAPGTTNYNCHSYAWYSQSINNIYWMNDPSPYWQDGSYTKVSGKVPTRNGQRLYYGNPDSLGGSHSAYVSDVNSNLKLTSKWGDYPLVKHTVQSCPYYFGDSYLSLYQR